MAGRAVYITAKEATEAANAEPARYPPHHPLYGKGTQLPNSVAPGPYVEVDGPVLAVCDPLRMSVSVLSPILRPESAPARSDAAWLLIGAPICAVSSAVGLWLLGRTGMVLLGTLGFLAVFFWILGSTGNLRRSK